MKLVKIMKTKISSQHHAANRQLCPARLRRAIREWREKYEQFCRNPEQQADEALKSKLREASARVLTLPSTPIRRFLAERGVTGSTIADLEAWQRLQEQRLFQGLLRPRNNQA